MVTFPMGQLVAVGGQDVMVYVEVVYSVAVEFPAAGGGGAGVDTGQTVVDRMMVSVVSWPPSGQLVMVGAQEVLV